MIVIKGVKVIRIGSYSFGVLIPKKLIKTGVVDVNKEYEVGLNEI